jgi:hypothetical protein
MPPRDRDPNVDAAFVNPGRINPGYAAFQIAKALATAGQHGDPATRERAQQKIAKWQTVLGNALSGAVDYGSRTPVDGTPGWVTLEVITGGFATGKLLAGGPLREHEKQLLLRLGVVPDGRERLALNAHFLTDDGLAQLQERLRTACYDVEVPEEAALMVVAWLAGNGHTEAALQLIDVLSPWFTELRFYPVPLDQPRPSGPRVHVQDVGTTIESLRSIGPNLCILAQKEAVEIWLPLYDRMIALFLETVEDDWPCRTYPADWRERAAELLHEHMQMQDEHRLCKKRARAKGYFTQLHALLARCAADPASLTGRDVGRIRHILRCYVDKHGAPDSAKCLDARRRQRQDVSAPTFHEITKAILPRLARHPGNEGLDDVSHLTAPLSKAESENSGLPEGTAVPASVQRKIERCLNETVAMLVARGLITSGESLARMLPQMTSDIRSAGIADPALRRLYAATYRAFRRRRSLLLLNLEKQIQIEELPWVAAIDKFRSRDLSSRELATQTLRDVTLLVIMSFPHAIIPNKLLQEMRALAEGAGIAIPLVDELAVDIFMGEFSGKFLESAKRAADLLGTSLYATYYGIDYQEIRRIKAPQAREASQWSFWRTPPKDSDGFARLCASRAGVSLETWHPVTNGMIIEQQQILTTQNFAALVAGLELTDALGGQFGDMAKRCFRWICRRHQMKRRDRHADLIMLKNTAYAWRQMVFFLALLPGYEIADFLSWAEGHLGEQSSGFQTRFHPALTGLILAVNGRPIDGDPAVGGARRFLGWSKEKHWLLE